MSEITFEFDWNESVTVAESAPSAFRPKQMAAVVGMRVVENDVQAAAAGAPIGTVLYMIEFADGEIVEVPASILRRTES